MSGVVDWWGKVPSEWVERRFKLIFRKREERSLLGEETLLSVSAYTGVTPRSEVVDDGDHLTRAATLEGYRVCYPNDLVMNIMLAWNRGLGFSKQKGIVSPSYAVFELIDNSDPRFLDYLLRSDEAIAYFKAYSTGVIDSRLRLYPETFGQLSCYLPPRYKQASIAAALDRETSKIDELVEKQRQLVKLLKEKRRTVIAHAITEGLDPNVPRKTSGLKWLSGIPAHWKVVPLKRVLEVKDGTHATPQYVDPVEDAFPLITSKDFGETAICFDEAKYISAEDHLEIFKRSNTECGDVLMSMIGGNIGKAVIVDTERVFSIKNVALFKTGRSEHLARYLLYYLQSGLLDIQIDLLSRGGAQAFLGLGDIRNLIFLQVPPEEMQLIVEYLGSRLIPYNDLIKSAEECASLMQERRGAVISAAVTGKIDLLRLTEVDAPVTDTVAA